MGRERRDGSKRERRSSSEGDGGRGEMRAVVVYYSATGSTKSVARAIHKGLSQVVEADLASVKEISPQEASAYDLIGIGSPNWYFRETANVRLFMHRMPDLSGRMGFVFCTHAATPLGIFHSMVPFLKRKGLTIIGWGDWYGSVHQVLHAPKPDLTDGHPDEIDLREAEEFGREMGERALRVAAGRKDLIPSIPKGPDADPIFRPHPIGEPFPGARVTRAIDLARCTYPECTVCEDCCPVGCVDFSKDPPQIGEGCWNCSLCNRLCPTGAIRLEGPGVGRMQTAKRIDMSKCRYPECTLCVTHCPMDCIDFSQAPPVFTHACEGDDLCWVICPEGAIEITNLEDTHVKLWEGFLRGMQGKEDHFFFSMLDEAEAKGRFRRLVPLSEVGWDNPIFRMTKTPRFDVRVLDDDI